MAVIPRLPTQAVYGQVGGGLGAQDTFILSAGSEFSPPGVDNYAAFPWAVVCPDGEVLMGWTRGGSHNGPECKLKTRRTTGGGEIYGTTADEVLYSDIKSLYLDGIGPPTRPFAERQCDTGISFLVLASGRILSSYRIRDNPNGVPFYDYLRFSDDNGQTWTPQPAALLNDGYDPTTALPLFGYLSMRPGGAPIELTPGGDLLWACFAQPSDDSRYDIVLLASSDQGQTWAPRGTPIQSPGVGADQFEEPQLGRLPDGRLMLLIRRDDDHTISRCYSSDEGLTWTVPDIVFPGWGRPTWCPLSNGLVIATTRNYDDDSTWMDGGSMGGTRGIINDPAQYSIYHVSRDYGLTWGPKQRLSHHYYLYTCPFEYPQGRLNIIHAYGSDTSLTRSVMALTRLEVG